MESVTRDEERKWGERRNEQRRGCILFDSTDTSLTRRKASFKQRRHYLNSKPHQKRRRLPCQIRKLNLPRHSTSHLPVTHRLYLLVPPSTPRNLLPFMSTPHKSHLPLLRLPPPYSEPLTLTNPNPSNSNLNLKPPDPHPPTPLFHSLPPT